MGNPTGIDVSSHNPGIDWQAAASAGLDFAFIKASEGADYRNPLFLQQWNGAKAAGIMRSAYHFYRWDQDPVQQAQWFLDSVGADRGEMPLTVDVENSGDGAGLLGPVLTAVHNLQTFVGYVKGATGRAPIIYTYTYMWQNVLGNPTSFTDSPLWLAAYQANQPRPVGGWGALTFWQNTDHATVAGVPGTVDADIFVGSVADFHRLAGQPDATSRFFPETGRYLAHGFLDLFLSYDRLQAGLSLRTCGMPLTDEYQRTDGLTYQNLENVMFQYDPKTGQCRICAGVRLLSLGY